MRKYIVKLSQEEREKLEVVCSQGKHGSNQVINALILLGCEEGEHQKARSTGVALARALQISTRRIDKVKARYVEGGLPRVLERKQTRVYKRKIDGEVEAHLLALSCSEPPAGQARWSLRLLSDRVVQLQYLEKVSPETIRQALKKTNLSRGNGKSGSSPRKKMRPL